MEKNLLSVWPNNDDIYDTWNQLKRYFELIDQGSIINQLNFLC